MTETLYIEPAHEHRPGFALWGLAQKPVIQTASATGWDVPLDLYPSVPSELLEGAYVDGYLYDVAKPQPEPVAPTPEASPEPEPTWWNPDGPSQETEAPAEEETPALSIVEQLAATLQQAVPENEDKPRGRRVLKKGTS